MAKKLLLVDPQFIEQLKVDREYKQIQKPADARQVGGSQMPVFRGARYQCGHGIGSALRGFFRRVVLPFLENTNILPFLRKNKRVLLGQALKTGMEAADDVVEGKPLKESAKRRLLTGINGPQVAWTGKRVQVVVDDAASTSR